MNRAIARPLAAISLACTLAITGCATTTTPTRIVSEARAPTDPNAFKLSAKAAIRSPQGNQSFRMNWERRASLHRIQIVSSLGTTVAELFADEGYAELWTSKDQPPDSGASLDALLTQATGISMNSEQVIQWLHGRVPADAQSVERLADSTSFRVVEGTTGWTVRQEFALDANSKPLRDRVNRLDVSQWPVPADTTKSLGLRLVVDQYETLTLDPSLQSTLPQTSPAVKQ
jgi:outer membrane biogenesis lipoprotein LolB